jgi:hypothetical protein
MMQANIQMTPGNYVTGVTYTMNPAATPNITPENAPALAARVPGRMTYGMIHLQTPRGWVYIPISQVLRGQVQLGGRT